MSLDPPRPQDRDHAHDTAAPAQVRTVTVMFTDLVDSTGLRVRLGEEAAERLRQRHDRLLHAAVIAHGGRVAKHTGDGVMAVFEGAADAITAAVSVQADLDAENRRSGPEPIRVRIGLSAGDVSTEGEDCFGLPVVEARRLESAAEPGQILISSLVAALARGRGGHELRSVGALDLKGLEAPLEALEVAWVPAPPAAVLPPALVDHGGFPFAGRTREVDALAAAFAEAGAGQCRLALVSGEPGIGKTRLAAQVSRAVLDKGGVVLAGRCDEMVGAPYQPFAEALAFHISQPGGAGSLGSAPGELVRLIPDLGRFVSDLPAPLAADPDAERMRLFASVRAWLAEAATGQGLVLVLDDLQWADTGTLLLLRHLVATQPVPGLLVVGTYRDTDLDRTHPLSRMLGELRRRAEVTRIGLEGLDTAEVTELVSRAAGQDLDEEGLALARTVHGEAAGNPFFVTEVLRHLAESGGIVNAEGRWVADAEGRQRLLPEGIREVVGRRVAALPEATQKALSTASVIGVDFSLDVLAAVVGADPDEVIDALEPARSVHLVTEVGFEAYRFSHALVRHTLLGEVSTTRRGRLHRSIATALEDLHAGNLDVVVTDLAYHWAEAGAAGSDDTAVAYARRAGELAMARPAPEDAAHWYAQAREMLGRTDPAQDAELACRTAEAMALGGAEGWEDALIQAARAAQAVGDVALMARALCLWGSTSRGPGLQEGSGAEKVELLEWAIDHCPEVPSILWARLTSVLVGELAYAEDPGRRLALAGAARAYLASLDDPVERFRVAEILGRQQPWSVRRRSSAEQGWADWSRVAGQAAAEGDDETEANALDGVVITSLWLGRPDFRQALVRWATVLARYPHPLQAVNLTRLQMVAALADGRPSDAEALAERAREQDTAVGRAALGRLVADAGRLQATREKVGFARLVDALRAAPVDATGRPDATGGLLALALAEAGRRDEALALIGERSAACFRDLPDDTSLPAAECAWSEAAAQVGHQHACAALYDRMLAYDGLHHAARAWYLGANSRYLALLSDALGRPEEADDWFARAEADHEAMQTPPWLARGRLDWAASCLRRGHGERARDLAHRALDAIGDLELNVSRARAQAILGPSWPGPGEPRPPLSGDGLVE